MKRIALILVVVLGCAVLTGCGVPEKADVSDLTVMEPFSFSANEAVEPTDPIPTATAKPGRGDSKKLMKTASPATKDLNTPVQEEKREITAAPSAAAADSEDQKLAKALDSEVEDAVSKSVPAINFHETEPKPDRISQSGSTPEPTEAPTAFPAANPTEMMLFQAPEIIRA